ncbi:MAG: efflux RND transporter periplasmic adaptor subunit [Cypionkella sp.]
MRLMITAGALVLIAALIGAAALPAFAQTAATQTTDTKPVDGKTAEAPAVFIDLPAITVTTVSTRKIEDHVLASGLIAPIEQVSVVPLIEGQPIETLDADVGDTVKAGQVLATLSTATLTLSQSQLNASLASAQASAADAQRTADRTATLLAQGSTPSATNDQAQAALISAKAQVTSVQAQLDNVALQISRAQVVAPVAGLITTRNAQIGSMASAAGQPMFVMIRDGALELRADVAEADVPRVRQGQTATIRLASGVADLTGTLRLVEPTVDITTRVGRARIAIDKPELVRSGMYAEADILVATHDALAVPVTAVGSQGSEATVMLVKDGTVHRATITTGIREAGWVEVLSGLNAGDQIVAKAGAFVTDGDKINPVPTVTN